MPFKPLQSGVISIPDDDAIAKKKAELEHLNVVHEERLKILEQMPEPKLGVAEFVDQSEEVEKQRVAIVDNEQKLAEQTKLIDLNNLTLQVQIDRISANQETISTQESMILPQEIIDQKEEDHKDAEKRYTARFNVLKAEKSQVLSGLDSDIINKNLIIEGLNEEITSKESSVKELDKEEEGIKERIRLLKPQLEALENEYNTVLGKKLTVDRELERKELIHAQELSKKERSLAEKYDKKNNELATREGEVSLRLNSIDAKEKRLEAMRIKLEETTGKKINI